MGKPWIHFAAYFRDSSFSVGNVGVIDRASYRKVRGSLLLLDIDSSVFPWSKLASSIRAIKALTVRNVCYARSRRGWHPIIEVAEKLTDIEIIAIQLALGDDRKRGQLNLQRYFGMKGKRIPAYWRRRWNLIFSRKIL